MPKANEMRSVLDRIARTDSPMKVHLFKAVNNKTLNILWFCSVILVIAYIDHKKESKTKSLSKYRDLATALLIILLIKHIAQLVINGTLGMAYGNLLISENPQVLVVYPNASKFMCAVSMVFELIASFWVMVYLTTWRVSDENPKTPRWFRRLMIGLYVLSMLCIPTWLLAPDFLHYKVFVAQVLSTGCSLVVIYAVALVLE